RSVDIRAAGGRPKPASHDLQLSYAMRPESRRAGLCVFPLMVQASDGAPDLRARSRADRPFAHRDRPLAVGCSRGAPPLREVLRVWLLSRAGPYTRARTEAKAVPRGAPGVHATKNAQPDAEMRTSTPHASPAGLRDGM